MFFKRRKNIRFPAISKDEYSRGTLAFIACSCIVANYLNLYNERLNHFLPGRFVVGYGKLRSNSSRLNPNWKKGIEFNDHDNPEKTEWLPPGVDINIYFFPDDISDDIAGNHLHPMFLSTGYFVCELKRFYTTIFTPDNIDSEVYETFLRFTEKINVKLIGASKKELALTRKKLNNELLLNRVSFSELTKPPLVCSDVFDGLCPIKRDTGSWNIVDIYVKRGGFSRLILDTEKRVVRKIWGDGYSSFVDNLSYDQIVDHLEESYDYDYDIDELINRWKRIFKEKKGDERVYLVGGNNVLIYRVRAFYPYLYYLASIIYANYEKESNYTTFVDYEFRLNGIHWAAAEEDIWTPVGRRT